MPTPFHLARCPVCGCGEIENTGHHLQCHDCRFLLRKKIAGREFSDVELASLMRLGRTGWLQGFQDAEHKPLEAALWLTGRRIRFIFDRPAFEARDALASSVPVHERDGRHFVRLAEIPEPWRGQFQKTLSGVPPPAIDGESDLADARDWKAWIYDQSQGEAA